ncbi:MAG: outer membrane lipid asymmetry maintenance protein MlaD [Alphaproteobacteria bacterium]|nr:outer membrane lipid asymmetry maintenance protein MlaD [Alphaproteobacteria bacterium]
MKRLTLEILVGALVVLIGFGFVKYAYSGKQVKSVQGYTLTARFAKVGTIQNGAPVRVAGVTVGRVAGMTLDRSNFQVVLDMTIEPDLKLPTDTRASITTDGLLGGKYVKVEPGQAKETLKPGAVIAQTKDAVALEDLVTKIVQLAVGNEEGETEKKQ